MWACVAVFLGGFGGLFGSRSGLPFRVANYPTKSAYFADLVQSLSLVAAINPF